MLSFLVSDLHLSPGRPETAELFLDFLSGPARQARALYILGDLFDYWLGDDDLAAPFNARICEALAALAAQGTEGYFLPGNRDFLADEGFLAATKLKPLADGCVVRLGGQDTLLLHGDTLCTDDADYQAFRATVRSPAWARDFLAQPLADRRARVEALRSRSEREKQTKPHAIMDTNPQAVAEAFRRAGVSRMIHGHTHRQAHHEHTVDGRPRERWVLGEWGAAGNALAVDDAGCRWLRLPL